MSSKGRSLSPRVSPEAQSLSWDEWELPKGIVNAPMLEATPGRWSVRFVSALPPVRLDAEAVLYTKAEKLAKFYSTKKEMENCCSIFFLLSEDYVFEKDTLIQLWMALGFIQNECIEQVGQTCFSILLQKGYIFCSGKNFATGKSRYKMNILDVNHLLGEEKDKSCSYLRWKNGNQESTISPETVQHVSLLCDDIDAKIFEKLQRFKKLKSLLFLHSYGHRVARVPDNLFLSFKELQVLDLSRTHIKELPSSVGYMIHLHYLDVSWTLIEWLPDIICSLNELQTLKLRGCSNLCGLPGELKRLTELWHLDVDVLRQLATMPRGIGALENLRTLSAFLVGTEDGCKIEELKDLNKLTGNFCIAMLEHVGSSEEARKAALCNKTSLKRLELRWSTSQLPSITMKSYDILESLRPSSTLEKLEILCYGGSSFPDWISDPTFDHLTSICFFKCEHVSVLPSIELLTSLRHLELVKMNGIKEIYRHASSNQAVFSKLEKLEIDEMHSLKNWTWTEPNEDDFKCLVELTIDNCPQLGEIHVIQYLSSIKHLEIKECSKLKSLSDKKLPDSLEGLIVEDCPQMKKRYSEQGGEDWYKIEHVPNKRICEEDEDDEES